LLSLSLLYEMTDQQKKLWLHVAEKTGSNLEARMVYDELIKILDMEKDTVIVSITETDGGLEVRVNEGAYGNAHIIGILERIKFTLLSEEPVSMEKLPVQTEQKYDA
jgi:hypothetical protein